MKSAIVVAAGIFGLMWASGCADKYIVPPVEEHVYSDYGMTPVGDAVAVAATGFYREYHRWPRTAEELRGYARRKGLPVEVLPGESFQIREGGDGMLEIVAHAPVLDRNRYDVSARNVTVRALIEPPKARGATSRPM